MRYLPHTNEEVAEMLARIGVTSMAELFDQAIAPNLQLERALDLPAALSEDELVEELSCFAEENDSGALFLGAGAYDHVTPAAVDYLKLDLEGAEYDLLDTVSAEALSPFDQVFVEFHHHCLERYTEKDTKAVVERLIGTGRTAFSLDDHNYLFY